MGETQYSTERATTQGESSHAPQKALLDAGGSIVFCLGVVCATMGGAFLIRP